LVPARSFTVSRAHKTPLNLPKKKIIHLSKDHANLAIVIELKKRRNLCNALCGGGEMNGH